MKEADGAALLKNTHYGRIFMDGIQHSTAGLAKRNARPDVLTQERRESLTATERLMHSLGTILGDVPAYTAFGAAGALSGNPAVAVGASVGLTEVLRETYPLALDRGEITSFRDFVERTGLAALATAKGGTAAVGAVKGGAIAKKEIDELKRMAAQVGLKSVALEALVPLEGKS